MHGKIIRGLAVAALACLTSGAALAAGETFKVISVNTANITPTIQNRVTIFASCMPSF